LANGQQFWTLLERQKQLFIEQKDKINIPILLKDFDSAVHGSVGGALLFAVCRGKVRIKNFIIKIRIRPETFFTA